MNDDEKKQMVEQIVSAMADRKTKGDKASGVRDWINIGLTILILGLIPLCWLVISQKIDLMGAAIDSKNKDTYIDKVTFTGVVASVDDRFTKQEQHLDFVDNRENSDKAAADLKIQVLQDLTRTKYSANVSTNRNYDP